MNEAQYRSEIARILANSLNGTNAHLETFNTFDGITMDAAVARVKDMPHTIWQLIAHIDFWQQWFLHLAKTGERIVVEHAADGWLKDEELPENEAALQEVISRIMASIEESKQMMGNAEAFRMDEAKGKYPSGYDVIQAMGNHISYHAGQVMLMRRMLGNYPPPSGGDTW